MLAIGPSVMLAGHLLRERIGSMAANSLQLSTQVTSMPCSCLAFSLQRKDPPGDLHGFDDSS